MRRVKQRVQIGMQLHYVRGWEEQILRSQWSYAVYLSQCQQTTPWCVVTIGTSVTTTTLICRTSHAAYQAARGNDGTMI